MDGRTSGCGPPLSPGGLTATYISFNMSLPLMGVGLVTLLLSLCFCCYLWKLRRQSSEERGYCQLSFSPHSKKMKNDVCPVCLEEFQRSEKLAVCPCRHGFHTKCLQQWLDQHNTCPMCKARVCSHAGERTGLITTTSAV
ncbi:hypothetical protein V1264_014139 [Littorina saxatilis]|uniref:RING-type domain-containing protein n=2 Tax=Littorina saxatilis TaxID=31220 RepID=A0AAN9GKP0_9CAEN